MKLARLFPPLGLLAVTSALAGELQIIKTHAHDECPNGVSQNGDTLAIHYRAFLPDGTEFDNTYERHRPFHFALGVGRAIKGWDQGLVGMCEGDKRTLIIPPELAYGDKEVGVIPPGSTLRFETELRGIYRPLERGGELRGNRKPTEQAKPVTTQTAKKITEEGFVKDEL